MAGGWLPRAGIGEVEFVVVPMNVYSGGELIPNPVTVLNASVAESRPLVAPVKRDAGPQS